MNKSSNHKFRSKSSSEKLETLFLLNDNFNSFDHVVDCLTAICDHDLIQAEQCALITHNKGRCQIMRSKRIDLEPVKEDLLLYGLNVDIY